MVTTSHNFCLSHIIAALRINKLASEGQAVLRAKYVAQCQRTSSRGLGTPGVKATHSGTGYWGGPWKAG